MTCHADAETQHMLELSVLAKAESRYRKMQADILSPLSFMFPPPSIGSAQMQRKRIAGCIQDRFQWIPARPVFIPTLHPSSLLPTPSPG